MRVIGAVATILPLLGACAVAPETASVSEPTEERATRTEEKPELEPTIDWDTYVERFISEYFEAHPQAGVSAGKHQYDGEFPDLSPAGIDREVARLEKERRRARAFDEQDLDARQRFERRYVLAQIDEDLFWLRDAEWPYRNPLSYTFSPSVYLTRPYAPLAERMRSYTKWASNLPDAISQMRDNLRTPLPRTYVETAHKMYDGMASYLSDDVSQIFAEVDDPELQEEFAKANRAAAIAVRDAARWLESELERADDDFAIGEELFREMLWMTERVDTPLDELERVGRADLERNLAALEDACSELAPERSTEECVALVATDKPEGGAVEAARDQLDDLKRFVAEHDLVSIPGTEEAKVEEAPPYNRWNFAYIEIPGPYETNLPSVYYIAPPDPDWPEEKQRDYVPSSADLLFVSVHEVWPGHFLQYLHANRAESEFGQIFVGYAFAEGWAHYTEEMMWEAGLGEGDPKIHVGQLMNALLRNVRFLSAIGLHTQGMTVEESEEMFLEKAFQDPGNAQQQAYRGTFDPAYLNYTMGKLMIRKMRRDWTADRGGRQAWKAFHDEFLSYGGPPLPVVREEILGAHETEGALF